MTLLARLRADAAPEWAAYVEHPFVEALGDGTLPIGSFRHYLIQDYLFLIQFARATALSAAKADELLELRLATTNFKILLDVELPAHVAFCAGWGIDEPTMAAEPEALETIAYTRFVLERGHAGDRLDLEVALAPCMVGYAEIGSRLARGGTDATNPYAAWMAIYDGHEFQTASAATQQTLELLWARRGSEARYPDLLATFRTAVRLEAAFWDMGLRG